MFPDLVVIYLGMRVNAWTGIKTLLGFGPQIKNSVEHTNPDGLLLHENFIMSLIPLHLGMRQYWRDFDALEAWARSTPHREWWATSFGHLVARVFGTRLISCVAVWKRFTTTYRFGWGFGQFAPMQSARGPMFSARTRAKVAGEPLPAVVEEAELYGVASPQ